MRTVHDIYEAFQTPPWLQLHQLRVAAVGEYVANLHKLPNTREVIAACLLHDIGAIVKFDFSAMEGLETLCPMNEIDHWRDVQKHMCEKYGELEHPATEAILDELNIPNVRSIVEKTGFGNMRAMIDFDELPVLIVQYADMRVAPKGIASIDERLNDVKIRYKGRLIASGWYDRFDENIVNAHRVEDRLFRDMSARPEDITEAGLQDRINALRLYEI